MTPLPVPNPEEYRRYPAHVLDRWMHVAAQAGRHDEAETIRKILSTPATEEAA